MGLFHTHLFKESEHKPGMLFCHCGKTKCLHDYEFKEEFYNGLQYVPEPGGTFGKRFNSKTVVYVCKICGDVNKEYF